MNAMIRTRNFGLVGVIALFLTGACASTSVTQAGAANRVTTPVKQMSDKELTQRHDSLQRSTADLKVRANREVQRGFHRVALEKYRTIERLLVQDIDVLSEIQARQPTLKERVRVQETISSVRTTLTQVRKTVRLLAFYARG